MKHQTVCFPYSLKIHLCSESPVSILLQCIHTVEAFDGARDKSVIELMNNFPSGVHTIMQSLR